MEPTISASTTSLPPSELDIHQLSLQMFMGKTQYQKYLAKSNPQSFKETQRKNEQMKQHEPQIKSCIDSILRAYIHPETYSMPTNLDSNMIDTFTTFVDKCVLHFEKLRATEEYQCSDDDDDVDTMFENIHETPVTPSQPAKSKSSWGKQITKTPITNTLDYYMRK